MARLVKSVDEQGYPEIDIARLTNHSIEAIGRYIKSYKDIKPLMEKRFYQLKIGGNYLTFTLRS